MPRPNCIIVEGPDGSGKSTLLGVLEKALGYRALHTGGASDSREHVLARCQQVAELAAEEMSMFDRVSQVSEVVYGSLRGAEVVSPTEMMISLLALRPLIIYCRRRDGGAESAVSKSDKLHKPGAFLWLVLQNYPSIVARYDELMCSIELLSRVKNPEVWFIEYDWTLGRETALLDQIKQLIEDK